MDKTEAHILVIRLSAMGDVAMCVPVLKALTAAYPKVQLTVLTKAIFAPFFAQLSVNVKVVEVNGKHKGIYGLYRLYRELRQQNITAVADLHNVVRSNLLKNYFKLSKIPFKQIDKGRQEKKLLTSWKSKLFEPLITTHQRYAAVFERLGYPVQLSAKAILDKRSLGATVTSLVGDTPQKWVGVAPFAKHEGKTYPLERSLQIIEELHKKNYKVLLFGGGKKEENLLRSIAQKFENVRCIAGNLNMRQELDLISNLDAMIAMDSGNGHLAAMFGISVITIWGVTHPYIGFAPFAQPATNAILPDLETYDKIPTSVYGNKFPDGYENAMKSILPETIIDRVIEVVG